MPTFRVKVPDGSIIPVNAPDGATELQAIEFAAKTWKPSSASDVRQDDSKGTAEQPSSAANIEADSESEPTNTDTGGYSSKVKGFLQDITPYLRPVVEASGAVAGGASGGILGGAAGGVGAIPGSVAGAGLGYSFAKRVMDLADEYSGLKDKENISDIVPNTAKDILVGATMEAGGQLAGRAIGHGINKVKSLVSDSTPSVTVKGVKSAAGKVLIDNAGDAPIYADNANIAAKVADDMPGFKMSLGESRNDPGLIKLQRGLERQAGVADDLLLQKNAGNREVISRELSKAFDTKNNVDDVISAIQKNKSVKDAANIAAERSAKEIADMLPAGDRQSTGMKIISALKEAKTPIQAQMGALDDMIPDYQMSFSNTSQSIKDGISAKEASAQQRSALLSIKNLLNTQIKQSGPSTRSAIGIRKTLNSAIEETKDKEVKRALRGVIKGLDEDLNSVSSLIKAGDTAEVNGSLINLEDVANNLHNNNLEIAKLKTDTSAIDYDKIADQLRTKKMLPYKDGGQTTGQYNKEILDQFKKSIGGEVPTTENIRAISRISDLEKANELYLSQLKTARPGADVAALMQSRNKFAREQYFGKFDKGPISLILAPGNNSGGKLPLERISTLAATPSGADDLINAIGKENASEIMLNHFSDDLLSKGELSTGKLNSWLNKNAPVLDKYGIRDKFSSLSEAYNQVDLARKASDDFGKSIAAKMLNADPEKAISAAFSGSSKNTGQSMMKLISEVKGDKKAIDGLRASFKDFIIDQVETTRKTIAGDSIISPAGILKSLKKYDPALQVLYKDRPEQLRVLKNIQQAVEIQSRSSYSPVGGGSDTAEIQAMQKSLGFIVDHIPGLMLAARLGRVGLGAIKSMNANEVNKLVARALYDPDLASALMLAARQKSPEFVEKVISNYITTIGIATKASTEVNQK